MDISTHVTNVEYLDSNIYVNIGSISIPKDNIACYATLSNNVLEIKNVNGEVFKQVKL